MQLCSSGKAYWEILKRFNLHRKTSPQIGPVAVRDMQRLQGSTQIPGVQRRINSFVTANRASPPGTLPEPTGPRVA